MNTPSERCDVLIIGAGAAGLSAGYYLQQLQPDLSVRLVEGRDAIGGRLNDGATMVHGHNTLTAALAEQWDIELAPGPSRDIWCDEAGTPLGDERQNLCDALVDYVAEHGQTGLSVAEVLDNNPLTHDRFVIAIVGAALGAYDGADPRDSDSQAFAESIQRAHQNGSNLFPVGGYGLFIDRLARGLDIQTDCWVTNIDASDPNQVAVKTSNSTLYAGHVVVAISLEALRRNTFGLELSAEQLAALNSLRTGNATKVDVQLNHPQVMPDFYSLPGVEHAAQAAFTSWWGTVDHDRVVGFCAGPDATALLAGGPEVQRAGVIDGLSRILHRDVSQEITGISLIDWSNEPGIWGSYSYTPVGMTNADRRAFWEPIGSGNVSIAGEYTDPDGDHGTVTAALKSGLRAAHTALRALQKSV